jgi:hypothetical protein
MTGRTDDWTARNREEDDLQRRVDRQIWAEARRIVFDGAESEPGLPNPYVGMVRAQQAIAVRTPEERAVAAVDRLGLRMRLDAERASASTARATPDDRER